MTAEICLDADWLVRHNQVAYSSHMPPGQGHDLTSRHRVPHRTSDREQAQSRTPLDGAQAYVPASCLVPLTLLVRHSASLFPTITTARGATAGAPELAVVWRFAWCPKEKGHLIDEGEEVAEAVIAWLNTSDVCKPA